MNTENLHNPWALQAQVMSCSGQQMADPGVPMITPTVLLYFALQCEELGEMACTLGDAVALMELEHAIHTPAGNTLAGLTTTLRRSHLDLSNMASRLRTLLAQAQQNGTAADVQHVLTTEQAIALLDDLTDITVVTCGAAVAAGLPGQAGYVEVQRSNMSKCNPDTGRIEKDASGKWIKGTAYVPPNLRRVLATGA